MKNSPDKEQNENLPTDASPEEIRRSFLKKFGKYAVSTPAVTFTLMSAMSSKAIASGGNNDGGGGF